MGGVLYFMKNKKIIRKITQGMYVLTTQGGGCIVDAVSQISSGDNPLIAVAVMKKNYTNELLKKNKTFALSVLGIDVDPKIIEMFGMNSARDIDKFEKISVSSIEGVNTIDDALGYMILEKIDSIENETHTLFIGKLIEADVLKEGDAMSYGYYQEHKDDLIKVKAKSGKTAWVCTICGYVYYGDELPKDFVCPKCGVDSSLFKKFKESESE